MKRIGLAAFLLVLAPALSAQLPPYGGADAFRADLAARRARVMEKIGTDGVAILWSAPARVYSNDVNYEFHQDSNLMYLTGDEQEETILVLIPGAKTTREILFTREADTRRELWNGHVLTIPEASKMTGITKVYGASAFPKFIEGLFAGTGFDQTPEQASSEFGALFDAVKAQRAKIFVAGGGPQTTARGGGPPAPPAPGSPRAFADDLRAKYPGVNITNLTTLLNTQRQVKTEYEQTVLKRSAEISAEAHIEGMKAARPGRWEYEVEAAIEFWYLKNGAMSWGYPSIVGSGPNATTLHYQSSTRQMQNGDLLLVDAAANFQGLTADITRTYPVNGTFTPEQRAIYDLVFAAQEAGIAAAQPGKGTADITRACRDVFGAGLLKLSLITDATSTQQIGLWFPHGPSHGIGLDVHDPLGTLVPGSAFTIEPGLYIRQDTLDNLPKTPENAKLVDAIQPAVNKYKNIGVRIEDSFLVTSTGVLNLSAKAPRKAADVEKIVGTGKLEPHALRLCGKPVTNPRRLGESA